MLFQSCNITETMSLMNKLSEYTHTAIVSHMHNNKGLSTMDPSKNENIRMIRI